MSRHPSLGEPGRTHIPPTTDAERVQGQIDRGEVRADADAAREIAARIEAEGGFWAPREGGTQ
jgi:hypothetical protein